MFNSLEKLKKKFGIKKHNKGNMRRKKLIIQKKYKLNKNQQKILNSILTINKLIGVLDDDVKEKSSIYVDEFIFNELSVLRKNDVKKKATLKYIYEDPNFFFESIFFSEEDDYNYSTSKLHTLSKIFTFAGEEYMKSIFDYIVKIYKTKEYDKVIEEKPVEDPYKVLGINKNDKITPNELTKIYRKLALEYHPDKHVNEEDEEKKKKYSDLFSKIDKSYKYLHKKISINKS